MKDLKTLNIQQLSTFFESFDLVLCDVHGVLVNVLDKIPGVPEAVVSLKKLGKRFIVVSNNTTVTISEYIQELRSHGYDIDEDHIATPALSMVTYLQSRNFDKKIFLVGTSALRKTLESAGFHLLDRGPIQIGETLHDLAAAGTEDDPDVGAVIVDMDMNLNYVNLQIAATYLKRSDVIFLKGAQEMKFPVGFDRFIIGCGGFIRILEEDCGREAVHMAKPSTAMNNFIVEKFQIKDPKRVLFIGDSVGADMGFATKFGYKKLLVLSGSTPPEAVKNWKFPDNYKPDYYVDSLKSVRELIMRIL